jgi:nitroreductase
MTEKSKRIVPPEFGEPMAPALPSEEARRLLALRRSASADRMTGPGPDGDTLGAILEIAARVPDHRKIAPFRFLIIEGDARGRAGDLLAQRFTCANAGAAPEAVDIERRRFQRAPVVVAVIARIDANHRTPVWEQTLTNGAVCLNLLLAASAHGFAGNWLTDWCAYDEGFRADLGLSSDERISGFIYLGTATEPPRERQRPRMADIVARF